LGISIGPAETSAGHQFPFRGTPLSCRTVRCAGPHFFEFTGTKSPKTKWKFTKVGEDWFCFAG
jgi:putative SOS response-associated peptidase YedK